MRFVKKEPYRTNTYPKIGQTPISFALPTKVVIYTHYPYPQYQKRCLALGADYFFDIYNDYEKLLVVAGELVKAKNAGSA